MQQPRSPEIGICAGINSQRWPAHMAAIAIRPCADGFPSLGASRGRSISLTPSLPVSRARSIAKAASGGAWPIRGGRTSRDPSRGASRGRRQIRGARENSAWTPPLHRRQQRDHSGRPRPRRRRVTGIVVDASVAVKWLVSARCDWVRHCEERSDEAIQGLQGARRSPGLLRFARNDVEAANCFTLALAVQEQYPVITADRRFHDIVRKHPYLSDRVVHLESLRP